MTQQLAEFYARKFFPRLGLHYGSLCVLEIWKSTQPK